MVKPISEKEFAKLAADDKGKIFIEKFMSGEILVYKMSNGQIIFNHRGKCGMCNNKKDFEKIVPGLMMTQTSKNILFGKNPWGKDFPQHEKEIIKELLQALGLTEQEVTDSLLTVIENKIEQQENPIEFRKKYFINSLAAIGAVFNKTYGGAWQMDLDSDYQTWVPNILYKGRKIRFAMYLWEDVFEIPERSKISIRETYGTIRDIAKMNIDANLK